MSSPAQGLVPNFNAWLATVWGSGGEFFNAATCGWFVKASNLVFGVNPPYYLDDFIAIFPKFFGAPTLYSNAATTQGSATVTLAAGTQGIMPGQFVLDSADFPPNTLVTAVTPTTVTFNNAALNTNAYSSLFVYLAPPIPIVVTQLYINLANASLVQARWQEQWAIAMGWFVAHYLTLYARSDAAEVVSALEPIIHSETPAGVLPGTTYTLSASPPAGVLDGFYVNGVFQHPGTDYTLSGNTVTLSRPTVVGDTLVATWATQTTVQTNGTPSTAQLAAQGLLNGILTSKSVGDVSASYNVLDEQAGWGTFRMTMYGAQLIDMARIIGSGPAVFW